MIKTGFYTITTVNFAQRQAAMIVEEEQFWKRIDARRKDREGKKALDYIKVYICALQLLYRFVTNPKKKSENKSCVSKNTDCRGKLKLDKF